MASQYCAEGTSQGDPDREHPGYQRRWSLKPGVWSRLTSPATCPDRTYGTYPDDSADMLLEAVADGSRLHRPDVLVGRVGLGPST